MHWIICCHNRRRKIYLFNWIWKGRGMRYTWPICVMILSMVNPKEIRISASKLFLKEDNKHLKTHKSSNDHEQQPKYQKCQKCWILCCLEKIRHTDSAQLESGGPVAQFHIFRLPPFFYLRIQWPAYWRKSNKKLVKVVHGSNLQRCHFFLFF